jgi:hypothetical protein
MYVEAVRDRQRGKRTDRLMDMALNGRTLGAIFGLIIKQVVMSDCWRVFEYGFAVWVLCCDSLPDKSLPHQTIIVQADKSIMKAACDWVIV